MATTPGGLRYPLGTDKVVDGDDAIHNLATDVDSRWFTPPTTAWTTVVVGALSATKPIVTLAFLATITTNAQGDGNAPIPAGLALSSLISASIVGRGSTAFNITGFLFGSSTLTTLSFRVYNANVAAASTSIAVCVTVIGQRA